MKLKPTLKARMILALLILPALAAFFVIQHSHASSNSDKTEIVNGHEAVAGEVIVKLRDGATDFNVADCERDADADHDEEIGGRGARLIHSRSKNAATLVRELSARGDVLYAEPNYIVRADAIPNDTSFGSLWGMQNTGQVIGGVAGTPGADISATAAWDISTGSTANVVAVIDTGIDYTHPDLAANVWSAPTAFSVNIGAVTINCAAGTHGFNAITKTCDPLDDNNHGSHVSGTIGGVGNNAQGVAGVNWTASIMGSKFLNAQGSGTTADAINAIEFTIQAKAAFAGTGGANVRVLSNSWGGGGFSQALLDEINKANLNNMLFVAAAGNSSANNDVTAFYPADYSLNGATNVVAVAATDNRDLLANFSNFGPTTVHLGAPGVNILSTVVGGTYSFFSGTSMATPHVSGAAVLVLSKCTLDTAGVKSNLLNNVDLIASLSGKTITGGRLNVNKAIRACAVPPTPDFTIAATPASQAVAPGGSTSYTTTITATNGFAGDVTFNASGVPAGATASFSPTFVTGSGSAVMTVTTSATTPVGSSTLTITGTGPGGAPVHSATVTLVVANPDFTIAATPASQAVAPTGSTNYTANVTATGGFADTVTFSASGLPAGATASFSPASVAGSGSSTMTVTTNATAAASYLLTITGTSAGGIAHSTTVTLVVGNPDFTLSVTPASRTIKHGNSGTYTVTITGTGGFSGTVTFGATGFGAGTTATFAPVSVVGSGSSTMTVRVAGNATRGTFHPTITGTSGALQHSVTVTLFIN